MAGSILVGVDGSTPSRSALRWSVNRARDTGASVELLHVADDDATARGAAELLLRTELEFARGLAPDLVVITALADGNAEDALVRRSSGHGLLVVGTHKTGFIYGRAFGSRFLGLARRTHCDVAFIPDQGGIARRGLVAGIEASRTGDAVILFAAAESERTGNELQLVGSSREDADRAAELVRTTHPDLRFRTRVTDLPLAEALVAASAQMALLVIGRAHGSHASALAANQDVLLNMSCPVLVLFVA